MHEVPNGGLRHAMRRLIDNKWYDTESARLVGTNCNGSHGDDYFRESLFRKRGGAFFLERQIGETEDCFAHSDKLYPMCYDKAREWAEAYLPCEVVADEFSGGGAAKKTLQLRITPRAKAIALREAARMGTSLSQYAESLILADGGDDDASPPRAR